MITTATFVQNLKLALQKPLPGADGQAPLSPEGRYPADRLLEIPDNYREGAVLLLLYPRGDNQFYFVLTRRAEYNGVHSGQISLPGGGREPGESFPNTALRETWEEVGVPTNRISILGGLTRLYIPPSNYMVYPFVGYTPAEPVFRRDRREVAEIMQVPLSVISDPRNRHVEMRDHPQLGRVRIPYMLIHGYKVWGATAMILSEFSELLRANVMRET